LKSTLNESQTQLHQATVQLTNLEVMKQNLESQLKISQKHEYRAIILEQKLRES